MGLANLTQKELISKIKELEKEISEKKKAQKILRKSEEKYSAVVENSNDGIIIHKAGKVVFVNQMVEKELGYNVDEAIGKNITDFIAPEFHDVVKQRSVARYALKTTPGLTQIDVLCKDASRLPVELNTSLIKYGGENALLVFIRNISERKIFENKLKESESKLKEAQGLAHIGHWNLDIINNKLDWSDEIYRIFGIEPQEFEATYEGFLDNIHPDDREIVNKAYSDSLKTKMPYDIIHRLKLKDGTIKYVNEKCESVFDDNGKPLYSTGTVQDITNYIEAENRIRKEAERTRLLLELYSKAPQLTDMELFNFVLDKAVALTDSKIGFFHRVDKDQNTIILTTWNKEALKSCDASYETHYPIDEAGNWVDCVHQKQPVIYNDFSKSPNQKGLPDGHFPLYRFISIPVVDEDSVHYIFGVGNKEVDYEEHDVFQIQLIANELYKIITQRLAEEEIRKLNEELEERVKKRTEELTQEKNFSDVVINSLPGTFSLIGKNGRHIRWNINHEEVTGFSAEEYKQMKAVDFFHKSERENVIRAISQIFEKEKADVEANLLTKSGKLIPYFFTGMSISINNTKYVAVMGIDISKREHTEKELRKKTEDLEAFNNVMIEREIRIIEIKEEVNKLSEQIGLEPPYPPIWKNNGQVDENITLRKTTENDLKNRSKDLEFSNKALEKSISAALSIMQDAHSQRERAENTLRELKVSNQELKKLNHAIEQSMATVEITDKTGKIEYVNPAFTKISGYTYEEALGHKPGILKSGKHTVEFYKNLWDTILAGKTWRGDLINKKKSGEEFWESASISPMYDKDGEITHFVAVKEDISDRKRLEGELIKSKEQAEQANKAKSTFLTNMSHEIRTPMNAILGFSEILSKRINVPSQLDYLTSIRSSGKTLLDLINNILDLSKIESGKLDFSYEPSNIRKLIQDIVGMLKAKSKEKNLQLNSIISDDLPNVLYIEELRIKQILINLINNSIKFTEKGYIEIETSVQNKSDDYLDLILKVEDTGIGIPKKYHKKVFQAFDQMDKQDSKKYEGTGLGLAITQQLVKQMNGRIELESEVGKGSVFTIILKKVKIGKEEMLIEERTEFDPDTIIFEESTVLIVDDIKSNRDVLKGYLSDYKINIIEAADGQETIVAIEKYKPDLVFLDLRMPVMDGYEANEIIKKNPDLSRIPIIAITASAFDKDEKKVIALGFSGYVRKPASLRDIIKLLIKYLKHTIVAKDEEGVNVITFETIDRLEEVLLEIDKKAMPVWEEIIKIRSKKNVLLLAELLIEIGKKYKATPLIHYGNDLLSASQLFNIDKEKNLIQQFPDFVKNLNPSYNGK